MSALKKRRYFARYFSIPLVAALLLVLVAKLVALQRSEMIADLADRVARRDSGEAATAVRQLAAMPRPPVAVLVAAAVSSDREVASEGQHAISKLLRRLQRQIESNKSLATSARQLTALAQSLDQHKAKFSTADHTWLSKTATKVLQLANRIPAPHSPSVAVHCDAVLAVVAPPASMSREVADADLTGDAPPADESTMADDDSGSRQASLRPEPTPPAAQPAQIGELNQSVNMQNAPALDITPLMPAESTTPERPRWVNPVFRMVPAMPINPAPPQGSPIERLPSPEPTVPGIENDFNNRPLAEADSRVLLEAWLHAEGSSVLPLEQELTRRGFGRLSARMVEQLFSQQAEVRMRLVDDVLTEPGVDARPWLTLLATDKDADVRLLAVTIMATSNDAEMIEQAWHVVIHDPDPRVAALAKRLRERRDGAQRR